jgi:mono/diheme cytochrome c family protein
LIWKRIVLSATLTITVAGAGWTQSTRSPTTSGFYSTEQAARGKALFATACASCHTADAARPADSEIPKRLPIALAGPIFTRKWATTGDLFSKVSTTMPADRRIGVGGLKHEEFVDIVAFLMQVNGLAPGTPVPSDGDAMKKALFPRTAGSTATAVSEPQAGRHYTRQQAERGRLYFYGSCNTCHTADSRTFTPDDLVAGRGFLNGRGLSLLSVVSPDRFAERWRNVGNLYNKIRLTMPGHDARGLSNAAYVDITAFMLSVNGVPAGGSELTDNVEAMRAMTLVEPGFTSVFNGRDFTGLKFLVGANCKPRPEGCGQTTPGTTFRIENGSVITTGRPYGYMYTDKEYLNFTLRLEYRYTPIPGVDDNDFPGNSGYLLFIKEHQVWPKYIEIQGANSGVLSVISTGGKAVFTVDNDARRRALRPVGEWNAIEIVSANGQIKSSLNGALISTISEHEYTGGHIGFQSEGSEIAWRNIRIKEN